MLSEEIQLRLSGYHVAQYDEIFLREQLEARVETYTLIKLAPWPARRWKCQYRLMMGNGMYDAQSVAEAYALALCAVLESATSEPTTGNTSHY